MASTYPSRTIRSKPFNYHHLSQLRSDRQTFYTLVAPIKDHRRAFSGDVKRGRNLFRVTTHRAICRGQIKLGDEKKKKIKEEKVSTHENCYFVERFAGKLIDHGMIHAIATDLSFRTTFSTFRCQLVYHRCTLMIFFFFFRNIYPWIFATKLEVEKYEWTLSSLERWKKFFKRVDYDLVECE